MSERSQEGVTRRHFLKIAAFSTATLLTVPDSPPSLNYSKHPFLGATFLPGEVSYWGREPIDILNQLLNTGIKTIRLPLYPNQVILNNLTETKRYVDLIDKKGGKVIWVVGLKQPGFPEIYPPRGLRNDAPQIEEDGFILDSNPKIVETELDIVEKSSKFINGFASITEAVQAGNESNYPVELARWRRYSQVFYKYKLNLLKELTSLPVIATYPETPHSLQDTRQYLEGLLNLKSADYIGLNVYPQKSKRPLSDLEEKGYWMILGLVFNAIRALGPIPFIAEQQFTPWLDGDQERPYSIEKSGQDFEKARTLKPARIDLWGIGPAASPKNPHLWKHLVELVAKTV